MRNTLAAGVFPMASQLMTYMEKQGRAGEGGHRQINEGAGTKCGYGYGLGEVKLARHTHSNRTYQPPPPLYCSPVESLSIAVQ